MSDQTAIQRRYLDPYEKLTSDTTNRILMAVYPDGYGLKSGLVLSIVGALSVGVTQGIAVKDFVVLHYYEDFTIEFEETVVPDGYYFIVLEYKYQKMSPAPTAVVKFVEPGVYSTVFHILLGVAQVIGNTITAITDQYPLNPSIERPAEQLSTHNSLPGIQGGGASERYHLTFAEYNIVHQLFLDGQLDHNELTNIQGGAPAAGGSPAERYHLTQFEWTTIRGVLNGTTKAAFSDTLDGYTSADFSLSTHTHDHGTLTNLLGGDGLTQFYHLSAADHTNFAGIVAGTIAIGDADKLDGKDGSEYANAIHNHQHNTLDALQGGNGTTEFYHTTATEHTNLLAVISGSFAVADANTLDGYDSTDFSLATHNHVHNNLTSVQGGITGERYHLNLSQYNSLIGILGGTVSVPNADKLDGFNSSDFAAATHNHNHNDLANNQGGSATERYHVFLNWYNAMANASAPSATNPFMTTADLTSIAHNSIGGLKGGIAGQYYHLSQDQHTSLVGGGDASSLHNHNTSYYTKVQADSRYLKADGTSAMTGNLAMGSNRITNVATPTNPSDGATKGYVDLWSPSSVNHNDTSGIQGGSTSYRYHLNQTEYQALTSNNGINDASSQHHHDSRYYTKTQADGRYLPAAGGTLTGNLAMSNNKVTGVAFPAAASDAVPKGYADSLGGVPVGAVIGKESHTTFTGFTDLNMQDSTGMWLYRKN